MTMVNVINQITRRYGPPRRHKAVKLFKKPAVKVALPVLAFNICQMTRFGRNQSKGRYVTIIKS